MILGAVIINRRDPSDRAGDDQATAEARESGDDDAASDPEIGVDRDQTATGEDAWDVCELLTQPVVDRVAVVPLSLNESPTLNQSTNCSYRSDPRPQAVGLVLHRSPNIEVDNCARVLEDGQRFDCPISEEAVPSLPEGRAWWHAQAPEDPFPTRYALMVEWETDDETWILRYTDQRRDEEKHDPLERRAVMIAAAEEINDLIAAGVGSP